MSQEKVNRYKEEKANRKELLAKAREMLAELKYLGVPETELLALVREGENDD